MRAIGETHLSISPAIRLVFVFAVTLFSAAPPAAWNMGEAGATPLIWAPTPASAGPLTAFHGSAGQSFAAFGASGPCFATSNDGTTVFSSADAQAVRDALAVAAANGTVKVAGYCAGVATQGGANQVAWITQTITLAGGYTTTDWTTYDPIGNPTTLDALGNGRVISASVATTLRGFTVTGGYISSTVDAFGAGIYVAGAMMLSELIVSKNVVTGTGGRKFGGGALASGPATVYSVTFSNNEARDGGGLFTWVGLTLSDTQFLSNTAEGGGGVCAYGPITLSGGLFQANRATSFAGGLFTFDALTLSGTQFLSNTASYGGGAEVSGAATLNGGRFQSNRADRDGGGLVARTLILTGTQFLSNTSSSGGGAHVSDVTTLNGGLFQSNQADYGGGLYTLGSLTLSGTQFLANTANDGGALYLNWPWINRVVNALFARNSATAHGAAIYVARSAPFSMIQTTIVGPTAPTGAMEAIYIVVNPIYVDAGAVYLTNTLIASHTIGIARAGSMVRDWNTLFAGVTTPYSGMVTSVGGITGAAGFANPASDDYHLGAGSAAVNAGIDAGVYTDFEGDVRPQGGGFDIGYDERLPITPRTYLPMVVR